jgi:predicted nucleotidyltransferase
MTGSTPFNMPIGAVETLCRRYGVRELALFGSALRADFRPDSDIDLLVEFQPESRPGLLTLSRLRLDLAELLGRPVDLVPKAGLKPAIRESVLASARLIYAE